MVSTLDSSSSLLLNSLYRNVLPPNCFLSLFLSFSFFLCRCSPPSVYLSQIPTVAKRNRLSYIVGLQFRHRTLPSSAGIQFAFTRSFSLFLPLSLTHCIVYSTLSSLSALCARSRSLAAREKVCVVPFSPVQSSSPEYARSSIRSVNRRFD